MTIQNESDFYVTFRIDLISMWWGMNNRIPAVAANDLVWFVFDVLRLVCTVPSRPGNQPSDMSANVKGPFLNCVR